MEQLNISSVKSEDSYIDEELEDNFSPVPPPLPSSNGTNTTISTTTGRAAARLASPTPVAEVVEISRLRHQLNEKNLQLIETRAQSQRQLQDMSSNVQRHLVDLATTKSELRRLKRARPLHRDGGSSPSVVAHATHATHATTHAALSRRGGDNRGQSFSSFSTSSSASAHTTSSSSSHVPVEARTRWPHELELRDLKKHHRALQSNHRALEKTIGQYSLRQMEHQDQCELLENKLSSEMEAREKMKKEVLRLQRQSATLGNELSSRVSLVESKSLEYRRRLIEAEKIEQNQEDEIRQVSLTKIFFFFFFLFFFFVLRLFMFFFSSCNIRFECILFTCYNHSWHNRTHTKTTRVSMNYFSK